MGARVRADEDLDGPEPDVCETPDTDALGLPATDEDPFRRDGNRAHDEEHRAAEEDEPDVHLETARSRDDPGVAGGAGEHGNIAISEKKQGLQRSAEDVVPRACRCRR